MAFQSTHSQGVRSSLTTRPLFTQNFNPRTHKECDCDPFPPTPQYNYFNPRTHKECDMSMYKTESEFEISIHALTRSAI